MLCSYSGMCMARFCLPCVHRVFILSTFLDLYGSYIAYKHFDNAIQHFVTLELVLNEAFASKVLCKTLRGSRVTCSQNPTCNASHSVSDKCTLPACSSPAREANRCR